MPTKFLVAPVCATVFYDKLKTGFFQKNETGIAIPFGSLRSTYCIGS